MSNQLEGGNNGFGETSEVWVMAQFKFLFQQFAWRSEEIARESLRTIGVLVVFSPYTNTITTETNFCVLLCVKLFHYLCISVFSCNSEASYLWVDNKFYPRKLLWSRPSLEAVRPPLWSSGQTSWLKIQRYRVRFPALPNFLSSSVSRTGSIKPLWG
jgi:hypothetical protein